jgi:hypothetical protein
MDHPEPIRRYYVLRFATEDARSAFLKDFRRCLAEPIGLRYRADPTRLELWTFDSAPGRGTGPFLYASEVAVQAAAAFGIEGFATEYIRDQDLPPTARRVV